jgi:hypothetical protein
MKFLLPFVAWFLLAACSSGPAPTQSPENPAETKAEVKARDEFARNLPKPAER